MKKTVYGIVTFFIVLAVAYAGLRIFYPSDQGCYGAPSTYVTAQILDQAIQIYAMGNNGRLPGTTREEIISALTKSSEDRPALVKEQIQFDSWGNLMEIRIDESNVLHIRSAGPDGIISNQDDIVVSQTLTK
jgi:hypothetical protein